MGAISRIDVEGSVRRSCSTAGSPDVSPMGSCDAWLKELVDKPVCVAGRDPAIVEYAQVCVVDVGGGRRPAGVYIGEGRGQALAVDKV